MEKEVLIFSSKVAQELMQSGFFTIGIKANLKMPGRTIFVFKNSCEIREHLKINHNIII